MKLATKLLKHHFLILILILLLALSLRIFAIKGNSVFFYFDQARDAIISTKIVNEQDLKIQGPSVSGTNDSVYHGVLYYYIISPAYVFGGGDPFVVSAYLAVISLISIIVTYKIGTVVFNSKTVGLIAGFFQAVSVISIQISTWLSNPNLSQIFLPLTYYYIWKIFLSEKKQTLLTYILFGLSIAASMQSALQNITVFGSVFIIFIYSVFNKLYKLDIQKIFISILTFFIGITTMLLTQILMYKRGILSLESLNLNQHETSISAVLPQIATKYFFIISHILVTQKLLIIPMFIVLIILIIIAKMNTKQIIWSIAFIFTPVWLLVWHYRDPNHTFIGIEIVIFLLLAAGLTKFLKQKLLLSRLMATLFIIIFALANFLQLIDWNKKQHHFFGIQKGAFLNNQLKTIDKTYEIAKTDAFSFSSLTSPYLINATWDYLYQWYGNKQYGYTPYYIGIDQEYFISKDVLEEKQQPEKLHFIILEPDTTLSDEIQNEFIKSQYSNFSLLTVDLEYNFGSIRLKQLAQ